MPCEGKGKRAQPSKKICRFTGLAHNLMHRSHQGCLTIRCRLQKGPFGQWHGNAPQRDGDGIRLPPRGRAKAFINGKPGQFMCVRKLRQRVCRG